MKYAFLFFLSLFSFTLVAQNTISGTVIDEINQEPIAFANVVIDGKQIGTTTDDSGFFTITSEIDFPWNITVSFIGYAESKISVGEAKDDLVFSLSQGQFLQEVTVSVQKREQSAKDVPATVTALSGTQLMQQNVTQLEDLQTPSVEISNGFQGPIISMRGINTSSNRGLEQSVGTFEDGVYAGRSELAIAQFLDLDQLEILKGPQPVFFGQSAIAGALSILSKKPSINSKEGYVNVKLATQSEYGADFGIDIPISQTIATRIAGRFNYFDGPFKNSTTDERVSGNTTYGGRLTTLFKPTDTFDATLKLGYNVVNGESPVLQSDNVANNNNLSGLAYAGGGADSNYPNYNQELSFIVNSGGTIPVPDRKVDGSVTPGVIVKDLTGADVFNANFRNLNVFNSALTLNYNLDNDYKITSISAYSQFESNLIIELDGSAYALFNNNGQSDFNQFSQELRLTSPDNDKFNWMAGVYYQTSDLLTDARRFQALTVVVPAGNRTEETATWTSAFASASINLTSKLYLEPGIRYSNVVKDGNKYDLLSNIGIDNATDYIGRTTEELTRFDAWTPQGGDGNELLDLQFSDDVFTSAVSLVWKGEQTTFYGRFAQGFKAGGFNANATIVPALTAEDVTFGSELATSYEVGIKTAPSRKWRQNISLFYTDYDDLQVSTYFAEIDNFIVSNAAKAVSKGIELDGQYRFDRKFSINYNAAFIDARYVDFISTANAAELEDANDTREQGQSSPYGLEQVIATGQGGIVLSGLVDRSDDVLSFAPRWEFSLNPRMRMVMDDNVLTLGLTYRVKGDHFVGTSFNRSDIQKSYGRLDFNIRFRKQSSKWTISLYGRNMTNQVIKNAGNNGSYIISRGLNTGLQFRYIIN